MGHCCGYFLTKLPTASAILQRWFPSFEKSSVDPLFSGCAHYATLRYTLFMHLMSRDNQSCGRIFQDSLLVLPELLASVWFLLCSLDRWRWWILFPRCPMPCVPVFLLLPLWLFSLRCLTVCVLRPFLFFCAFLFSGTCQLAMFHKRVFFLFLFSLTFLFVVPFLAICPVPFRPSICVERVLAVLRAFGR